MGSKIPTDIKIEGKWYAKIENGSTLDTARYTKIDKGIGEAIEKSTSYGKAGNSALQYSPQLYTPKPSK